MCTLKKLVIFFMFMNIVCCYASNWQEAFLQANKFYLQNEYKEAFNLYNSIKRKGSATWYNMGNASFKLGNYIDAIVYWSKAKVNVQTSELNNIDFNISVAREKLGNVQTKTFLDKFYNFFNRLFVPFSILWLQIIFILFWFAFFISLTPFDTPASPALPSSSSGRSRMHGTFRRSLTIYGLLLLNLFLGVGLFAKYRSPNAIVAETKDKLFSGPDQQFHVVGNVVAADEVCIKQKRQNWYKVKCNGTTGWILADKVKII